MVKMKLFATIFFNYSKLKFIIIIKTNRKVFFVKVNPILYKINQSANLVDYYIR